MRRSVVKQGANTLMISLPSAWAREHGITKGVELDVTESLERLTIRPTAEPPPQRIEIDISAMGPAVLKEIGAILSDKKKPASYADPEVYKIARGALLRLITSHYKSGYDEILIRFDDPNAIELIQQALGDEELSDYEIVEQKKNYCVLQDIGGVRTDRLDSAVHRIFFLLMQMAEESIPSITNGAFAALQPLRYLEQSNNRFTTYCRRLLSKKGYVDSNKTQFLYTILHDIEMVADQYKYLFDALSTAKGEIRPDVIALYAKTAQLIRTYYEFYASGKLEHLVRLCALRHAVVERAKERFTTANSVEIVVIHYLIVIAQITFELNEPTISLAPWENKRG